jgi:hypothetical protein
MNAQLELIDRQSSQYEAISAVKQRNKVNRRAVTRYLNLMKTTILLRANTRLYFLFSHRSYLQMLLLSIKRPRQSSINC